jgi:O-antigen ligase
MVRVLLRRNIGDMVLDRSRYYHTLAALLLLFGLTLPLSKSAGNVILFLSYTIAVTGFLLNKNFKVVVFNNSRQPLTLAFSLFFLVALIGVLFTDAYSDGFHVANKFFSLPAIYLMASVLIQSLYSEEKRDQKAEYILLSFLAGLMVLNGIGIMTFLGIVDKKQYVTPLAPLHLHHIWFSNINAIGLYTAVSFLLFSRYGKSHRGKLFLVCSIVLGIFSILLSVSRTAWFGTALTSAIMALLVTKNKKIIFVALVSAALVGIIIYLFIPLVHDRIHLIVQDISSFSAGKTETSLGMRFLMWKAAIMMFLSNPLVGVGTGGYVPTMMSYVASGQFPEFLLQFNQPHNMYLFALATNGLLGLASLLYLFYRILILTLPVLRAGEGGGLFAFLAAATAVHYLIAGLTDSFFNIQILRYTFVFIMGVCIRSSLVSAHRDQTMVRE